MNFLGPENGNHNAAAKPALQSKRVGSQLVGGSLTLLASSGVVGVTNLIYNVASARLLGPDGFAHATAVYTMLMLLSAITLSFQVVCAKYVARRESYEDCLLYTSPSPRDPKTSRIPSSA